MSAEWKEYKLTDLYEISSGLSKPASAFGSGFPFLSFKEVFNNYFLPDELEQLVESSEKERQKGSIKRGDVFLTRTSETMHELGMSSVALKDYEEATFNGFSKKLRPKPEIANLLHPEFIGYSLRSPSFRTSMLAFSTMSTRASLNNEMIGRLTIKLPDINDQIRIARILKSLDDKAAINKEINQSLEQIAQAIFKSWFVDFEPVKAKIAAREALLAAYAEKMPTATAEQIAKAPSPQEIEEVERQAAIKAISGAGDVVPTEQLQTLADLFPNQLVESELGEIPEGWEVKKVEDIVTRLKPKQRFTKKQVEPHGKVPVYEQGAGILLGYQNGEAGFKATPETPIFIFGDHTCVTHLSCEPFDISSNVIPLEGCDYPTLWVFQAVKDLQEFQEYRRHWSEFIIKHVVTPSSGLAELYSDLATNLVKQKEANVAENSTLSQLRNVLLPKLLSGEVELTDKEAD